MIWFRIKCAGLRLFTFFVMFPISLLFIPYKIFQRTAVPSCFWALFSPREWDAMIGDSPEILLSKYRITGSDYPKQMGELPDAAWYHAANKAVHCALFEDAAWVRLRYNGVIKTK